MLRSRRCPIALLTTLVLVASGAVACGAADEAPAASDHEALGSPRLASTDFVFVRGCIFDDCNPVAPWNEYETELRTTFLAAGGTPASFQAWRAAHLHFLAIRRSDAGANDIRHVVAGLPAGATVSFLGHSAGGAAIMQYLYEESGAMLAGRGVRVVSATTVDAPLGGDIDGWKANVVAFSRHDDDAQRYGAWLTCGTDILNVDSPQDDVSSSALPGVPFTRRATYPTMPAGMSGTAAHAWTFSHVATEVRHHLARVWK